ncbi:MAG: glycosyltransferase [Desulforhopalus sp.]|jgi:glycosyltransferase involved in cell wall biosynthesis|nr:glycosyltransferase [Desulforhopalus sp.]
MKIAQITQVCVPVPPKEYGGTELVVSLLTEELVRRGHDVTLFATGDAVTKAKLHSTYKEAVGFERDTPIMHLASVSEAFKYISEDGGFDIIHNHAGHWGITLSQFSETPVVTTLHNDYFTPGDPAFEYFRDIGYYVAISRNQMKMLAGLNFAGMVYNAIDTTSYTLTREKEDYLLFFGNMSRLKGADIAVKTALDLRKKLIICSKIDSGANQDFFDAEVKPYVDNRRIIFHPPVGQKTKHDMFSKARCFLFPIDWEEPFGLVMIEAMACGTPVVAYKRGSVPEVIMDGQTGFVVETYEEFLAAVKKVDQISPEACRQHVEENFSVQRMTASYLEAYRTIIEKRP